jgi:tRNA threonylcarbamoyladenosine biosynthesis protein TsaE
MRSLKPARHCVGLRQPVNERAESLRAGGMSRVMAPVFCFRSEEPRASEAAARLLAAQIPESGLVMSLVGPLGAGKTLFVQGLAAGLGLDPADVSSPTFSIVNEYPLAGRRRLVHVDMYRLESEADLEHVGFLDLLDSGTVLAAEWGDRFPQVFPRDHLELTIERSAPSPGAESVRVFRVSACGERSEEIASRWRDSLVDAVLEGLEGLEVVELEPLASKNSGVRPSCRASE